MKNPKSKIQGPRQIQNPKSKINGFTLVETILTIMIVGIIAGVTAKILMSGLDTYAFITNRKDATQHARVAMERMASELVLIKNEDIRWMNNDNFGFWDRDGQKSSFKKDTMGGRPVLSRGDESLWGDDYFLAGPLGFIDFDYLRADGTGASSADQVRKINIELSVESLGGYGPVTLRTEVFPRNMMYDNFQ